jgi:hypothetical protein
MVIGTFCGTFEMVFYVGCAVTHTRLRVSDNYPSSVCLCKLTRVARTSLKRLSSRSRVLWEKHSIQLILLCFLGTGAGTKQQLNLNQNPRSSIDVTGPSPRWLRHPQNSNNQSTSNTRAIYAQRSKSESSRSSSGISIMRPESLAGSESARTAAAAPPEVFCFLATELPESLDSFRFSL